MGGAWADPRLKPVSPTRTVWGEYGSQKLGLPWIVSMLEQNGLAATFFVEVFMEEQGYPGAGEKICQYLLEHKQDVQLHIHPNHKHFGLKQAGQPFPFTDCLADLSTDAQLALLQEGCERLRRWTGQRPTSFRAGNMAASEQVLTQVAAAGLAIDSSYTFPFAGGQCRFSAGEPYNGSKWYGPVLEMALSGFRQTILSESGRSKPLDLMGVSFEECRDAVRKILRSGADAVMILHSFSLFKVRNVQYDGGKADRIVSRRFRRFCEWLSKERLPVYTFSELARAVADSGYQARCAPPCRLTHPRGLVRKVVQVWNRSYWT
jgi:hypothetical protein